MKNYLKVFAILFLTLALGACQKSSKEIEGEEVKLELEAPASLEGVVTTTMNQASYTYVEIESNGKKHWAAVPQTEVKVGDKVTIPPGSMMYNFESKSLNKTFDEILFAGGIVVGREGGAAADTAGSPGVVTPKTSNAPEKGSIKKAAKGYTVEELYAKKAELVDKEVSVRGKIVKSNMEIMGTNWYHIQDGSGAEGAKDVIFTSTEKAETGQIVLAKGMLKVDKDFGSGYKFDVIVEESTFTVE
ncbi:MAG: DNA-binding protein [bacterium]|nr:DNA-binding protein [bacterium]